MRYHGFIHAGIIACMLAVTSTALHAFDKAWQDFSTITDKLSKEMDEFADTTKTTSPKPADFDNIAKKFEDAVALQLQLGGYWQKTGDRKVMQKKGYSPAIALQVIKELETKTESKNFAAQWAKAFGTTAAPTTNLLSAASCPTASGAIIALPTWVANFFGDSSVKAAADAAAVEKNIQTAGIAVDHKDTSKTFLKEVDKALKNIKDYVGIDNEPVAEAELKKVVDLVKADPVKFSKADVVKNDAGALKIDATFKVGSTQPADVTTINDHFNAGLKKRIQETKDFITELKKQYAALKQALEGIKPAAAKDVFTDIDDIVKAANDAHAAATQAAKDLSRTDPQFDEGF